MSRKSKLHAKMEAPASRAKSALVTRFVMTTLIVLLILYVGLYLLAGTDGFRSFVEDRLSTKLGLPVTLEKVRADWKLGLIVQGAASTNAGIAGVPSVSVESAHISWSLKNLLRPGASAIQALELNGVEVCYAQDETGSWSPATLAGWGGILESWGGIKLPTTEAPKSNNPESRPKTSPDKAGSAAPVMLENLRVELKKGSVIWWGADQAVLARVDDIQLVITPIEVPGRSMTYYRFLARSVTSQQGARVDNINFEVIKTGGKNLILGFEAGWGGGVAPAGDGAGEKGADPFEGLLSHTKSGPE